METARGAAMVTMELTLTLLLATDEALTVTVPPLGAVVGAV